MRSTARPYASSPLVELALVRANGSGGGSASGPLGAIQFSDGSGGFSSDDPNLHFDAISGHLGLGTTTPFAQLSIVGNDTLGSGLFLSHGQLDVSATINSHITVQNATFTLDTLGGGGGIGINAQIGNVEIEAGFGHVSLGVANTLEVRFVTDPATLRGRFTTTLFETLNCSFSLTGNASSSLITTVGNINIDPAAALDLGASTATSIVIGHGAIPIGISGGIITITPATVMLVSGVVSVQAASTAFILNVSNTQDDATGGGLLLSAGASAATGASLVSITRPDTTELMNITQTALDAVSILPSVDNTGAIGSPAFRWALVRATVVTTGDLEMISEERNAHWVIQEETDCLAVTNKKTNKKYRMVLEPY